MRSRTRRLLGALCCVPIAALAHAQSIVELANTGPTATAFKDIDGLDNAEWFTIVNTALPPAKSYELWSSGITLYAEGSPTSLVGAVIGDGGGVPPHQPFVSMGQSVLCPQPFLGLLGLVDDANPLTPPVITTANDRALAWGSDLLVQESQVTTAPEVAAGTIIRELLRSTSNKHQDSLALAILRDPVTGVDYSAVVTVDIDPTCTSTPAVANQHVLFKTGDALPSSGAVFSNFAATEKRSFDYNARGDYMFVGAFSTSIDRRIVLNGRGVLSETQPVPGGIGAVTSLQLATVDVNDVGDYVIQTRANTGTVLIRGSVTQPSAQTKFIQVGDPVPDPDIAGGAATLARIGASWRFANGAAKNWAPAIMTNGGDIVWFGEWNEFDEEGNLFRQSGIFVNHKCVAKIGSTTVQGSTIDRIGSLDAELRYELEASPNGRYLLFEAGTTLSDSVLRIDLGESVPFGLSTEGCSYAYPPPSLEHVSDDIHFGDPVGFGGFPLVNGKNFFVSVDSTPPVGANSIVLVFNSAPHPAYPCGAPFSGIELLLGGTTQYQVTQPVTQPVFTINLGTNPSLIGQVSYAQAYFIGPGGVLGATNGIRFVFGAP
ncbi:MAG: hypothetical protein L6Q99_06335 [Planctomycetes bacterium]|nr:hypothetical protein [Planctomycetota bacterium]